MSPSCLKNSFVTQYPSVLISNCMCFLFFPLLECCRHLDERGWENKDWKLYIQKATWVQCRNYRKRVYTLQIKGAHCPSPKAQRIPVKESEEKRSSVQKTDSRRRQARWPGERWGECSWGPAAHPTPAFWGEALPEAPRRKPTTPPLHHST